MEPEIPPPDAIPAADQTRPCAAEILRMSKTSVLVCPSNLQQDPLYTR